MPPIDFNPRSREGSDCKSPDVDGHYCEFQSTLPRRERLHVLPVPLFNAEFQSTLPRRERRLHAGFHGRRQVISIHAPAKGATSARWFPWSSPSHFNPRSREGSDISQAQLLQDWRISTTLPRRERRCAGGPRAVGVYFQSTLPRRERHCRPTTSTRDKLFQSTLREGSDANRQKGATLPSLLSQRKRGISIHAPVKGATYYRTDKRDQEEISIHAPVKGATLPA